MPALMDVTKAALPAGMSVAQWLASRRGLNQATNTAQQGATVASGQLNQSSAAAIAAQRAALEEQRRIAGQSTGRTDTATATAVDAQKKALDEQRGLYDTTVRANSPYSEFGTQSLQQLQDLQAHPETLRGTPGYQFGLDEALKAQERTAAARGTAGNGGQVRAQTRNALDYASTKYQQALDNLNRSIGVGERANAANASAGVTLGGQIQTSANNVGNLTVSGAQENNQTMGTLGNQVGANADKTGNIGLQNAEDQAALTIAQAELAAKNQSAQGVSTADTIGKIAQQVPTIAKSLGLGGAATAAGGATAAGAGGALAIPAGLAPLGATGALATPTIAAPALAAGAPASGITGALGLGGGSGLFGLGAATIPVVGGIIAGAALLANHFIGEGRKAADKLTGQGGIQHAFEDTLSQIDAQPEYTESQKWESKVQAYGKLKELALKFAEKGKNEHKVASQMFDEIAHLFGETNPLKAAA